MKHHDNLKSFECKQCNKGFTTAWGLKLHERIHTESKPHKGSVCEKRFRQSSHLQQHKRIHSEQKSFKCNKCDLSFNQSSNLQQHIKELHDFTEHPYGCSQCQQKFSRASYLQIHQRIYSEVKPFRCEHCNRPFRFLSSLYWHCRKHLCEENGDMIEGSIFKEQWKSDLKIWLARKCTFFEEKFDEKCNFHLENENIQATQENECWICLVRLTDPADMINHVNEHCQLWVRTSQP